MSQLEKALDNRIREIVREEIRQNQSAKSERLFTPDELAKRWRMGDKQAIYRLVKANQLRPVRLSERSMVFTVEEVRRFEEAGGVDLSSS